MISARMVNGTGHDTANRKAKHKPSASESRTLALEKAYVHDVYSFIASNADSTSSPVHSHVKRFIADQFEPGSVLLDIGCSNGQYLNLSPDIVVVGLEHCSEWFRGDLYKLDRHSKHLVVGNVLYLPFRDGFFDGVLCCSVLHHLSTLERRVNALKEIARILKIGGKLLLTVTSGPSGAKEVESQDVLIRVDTNTKAYSVASNPSASDTDDPNGSYPSSSSSSTNNSSVDLHMYENCTSPTSSEFDNCYTFVKKALKRFSLTSSIYSMKNSSLSDGSSKSKFSANHSIHDEMCPIELRNLDDGSPFHCSSRSSSSTGDSALSSYNRSSGCISQTSSNNMFPSSLLSVIKEHLISWKVQFTNTMAWYSMDPKTSPLAGQVELSQPEEANHRFSLPLSFRKGTRPDSAKNILAKNKVYASNGLNKPVFRNFAINGASKQVELNLTQATRPNQEETCPMVNAQKSKDDVNGSECENPNTSNSIVIQKSLSSQSSRQTSFERSGYKLIAYYSMPELRTLDLNSGTGDKFCLMEESVIARTASTASQLHSPQVQFESHFESRVDCDLKDSNENGNSESKECLLSDVDCKIDETAASVPFSTSPASVSSEQSQEGENSLANEMADNPGTLEETNLSKFPKKLLRQRSFSADYQPEIVKFQPELPRRFSASPNIGTHRYNNNNHTPHQQQISIDSEESFVTIIPAIRSTRDSIADIANACDNLTDFDLEEEDELASPEDFSPTEVYSCSSDDDDAYCENLSPNAEQSSDENTSISSVLEATIRSVSKSDSKDSNEDLPLGSSFEEMNAPHNSTVQSAPTTLHRYYHLFRSGELENLIEEHVQNLHIIDSFYNEYATSWCIVAEKIQVWTI